MSTNVVVVNKFNSKIKQFYVLYLQPLGSAFFNQRLSLALVTRDLHGAPREKYILQFQQRLFAQAYVFSNN